MRPIDADALKRKLCEDCGMHYGVDVTVVNFKCSCAFVGVVDEMPTIDIFKYETERMKEQIEYMNIIIKANEAKIEKQEKYIEQQGIYIRQLEEEIEMYKDIVEEYDDE